AVTSPPPMRAATVISLISLVNSLPRLASAAPFLCLMVCHLEWPLMAPKIVAGGPRVKRLDAAAARIRGRIEAAPGGRHKPGGGDDPMKIARGAAAPGCAMSRSVSVELESPEIAAS